jgi:hypothetical protein
LIVSQGKREFLSKLLLRDVCGDEDPYPFEFRQELSKDVSLIGQTTLNTGAPSKSAGVRFPWSAVLAGPTRIWTGKIGYPTSAKRVCKQAATNEPRGAFRHRVRQ